MGCKACEVARAASMFLCPLTLGDPTLDALHRTPCTSQDPTIQRMTEAIASDPEFMEIAKEMQESMLSGNMNGLNLGGEVSTERLQDKCVLELC